MRSLIELIRIHSERLSVDADRAFENLMTFSELVGRMENDGKLIGKNPQSTAKGLYQFIDGSVEPAINRTKRYLGELSWMKPLRISKNTNTLSWEQQTLLFLGDMLGKRGTDKLMKHIMISGDREAMKQAYLKFHHTNPDEATLRRAEVLFNGTLYDD